MSCCKGTEEESELNKPRGCTNVICLALFIIFWGVLLFVAAFAFVIGDPTRLEYGQDSFGNVCGKKNEALGNLTFSGMDMTDRKYLFFLNMSNVENSLKICVKKCPGRTLKTDDDIKRFQLETGSSLCRYDFGSFVNKSTLYPSIDNATIERIFERIEEKSGHRPCPIPPVYGTVPLFKRCVPVRVVSAAKDIVYNVYAYLNSFDIIQQVVSDIHAGANPMKVMVLIAFVLSMFLNYAILYIVAYISWVIVIVFSIALLVVSGLLWYVYLSIKWELDATPMDQLLVESTRNETTFLVYAIISTVFTVVLLLVIIVLRKRFVVVMMLFKEAGKCIRSMPFLLFQPIWTVITLLGFFIFWIVVLLALSTAYYPVKNEVKSPVHLNFPLQSPPDVPVDNQEVVTKALSLVSYSEGSWVQYMWWYHLIALIWTSEFILACQQMVIAGAVATWYFSKDRGKSACFIAQSIGRLLLYHMGSVALGSFLITLFKVPRIILTYIETKMKKHEDIWIVSCCLKCCVCCLWCLEKAIRYLNHNAYTVVAIQGIDFCPAAKEAFQLLVSNAVQVAVINSVGDFILFLGKCAITAIAAFAGILMMRNDPQLHFYAIPVFLGSVFSFFIAHCVLSVYEMVVDTLFLCCCEDMLRNDGSEEKPFYGGALLRYLRGDDGQAMQPLKKEDEAPKA